jgi:K(+)-stimulated pyrophosphate-energized sodium pump
VPSLDIKVGGYGARMLLQVGLVACLLGIVFGLSASSRLRAMPVHKAMAEISDLIYATCKTYLETQGKFIMLLWVFVGAIIAFYFGKLQHMEPMRVGLILLMSLIGIAGSYGVAWFGIRVNTYANSRAAFASLKGEAYPVYGIPLLAGMSIGMVLISVELLLMLLILLYMPGEYAGACFIGFAIGESLGAAALRIAGGIFTKIADIGSDLMKIVFKIKEDDARNPGVIADCTGDNAGDSVGPSADGFETYGVTGVALITYTLLAVKDASMQVQILVWLFVMRVLMVIASGVAYFLNEAFVKAKTRGAKKMDFEHPLTQLVWVTSFLSIGVTFLASKVLLENVQESVSRRVCGGSCRRSSRAARSPARSSRNSSKSSPRPTRATFAKPSMPRRKAARRSTFSPDSPRATTRLTGRVFRSRPSWPWRTGSPATSTT